MIWLCTSYRVCTNFSALHCLYLCHQNRLEYNETWEEYSSPFLLSYSKPPFNPFHLYWECTSVIITNASVVLTSLRHSLWWSVIWDIVCLKFIWNWISYPRCLYSTWPNSALWMFVESIELLPFAPQFPLDVISVGAVKFLNSGLQKNLRAKLFISLRAPSYCTDISGSALLSGFHLLFRKSWQWNTLESSLISGKIFVFWPGTEIKLSTKEQFFTCRPDYRASM